MQSSDSARFRIRPLKKDDAYSIGVLTKEIYSEIGCEPLYSVEATLRLFETPWLQDGAGIVLEYEKQIVGYGWTRLLIWHSRNVIHLGLFLGPKARNKSIYQMLTDELERLSKELVRRFQVTEAMIFYRGIDTIHPPIIREWGFRQHPVSLLGFRHDLKSLSKCELPQDLVIRPAHLPEEKRLIDSLGIEAFDDPVNQGDHIDMSHLDIAMGIPGVQSDQFLIAEYRHVPVGYLLIFSNAKDNLGINYDIAELGVIPKFRRKGIGTALLSTALHWAKKQNAKNVFIASRSSNPIISLYWRLKFRPDPARTYHYFTKLICL